MYTRPEQSRCLAAAEFAGKEWQEPSFRVASQLSVVQILTTNNHIDTWIRAAAVEWKCLPYRVLGELLKV
jgi:hypothetical protein